jgi:hypothetical protein
MVTADALRDPFQRDPARCGEPDALPIAPGDVQVLDAWLARASRRRNALLLARHCVRALLPAALLSALGVLAYRFFLLDGQAWMPPALLLVALVVGFALGWRRRAGAFAVAREADAHFELRDLLSSALSFSHPQAAPGKTTVATTSFVSPLVREAARQTSRLNVHDLYPLRFDRASQVLAASLTALVTFALMPDNPRFLSPERRQLNAVLQEEGQKLQELARTTQQNKNLSQDARAQIAARKLEALSRRMRSGRMTKKEALLGMEQLKRALGTPAAKKTSASPDDARRFREALAAGSYQSQDAQAIKRKLEGGNVAEAARRLEELARKVEQDAFGSQAERDKAARDLQEAARALRKAGGNEQAAQQLDEAAKQLREGQGQSSTSQNSSGQQNGQGQQGQGQQGQNTGSQKGNSSQGSSSGSQALRDAAQQLRSSQPSPGNASVREMLKRLEESQSRASGSQGNSQGQSGQGQNQQGQDQQGQDQNGRGQSKQGQSGQGQGGKGQGSSGQQSGDGRQVVTPGQDIQPSDPTKGTGGGAGLGPRSNIKGSQGGGGGVSKQRGASSNDSRRWEDVWSDKLPQARKQVDRVRGKMGDKGEAEQWQTQGEARGGTARTPYYDVYESYRRDAEDAIARESVPPAYRDSVKEYFDRVKPGQ